MFNIKYVSPEVSISLLSISRIMVGEGGFWAELTVCHVASVFSPSKNETRGLTSSSFESRATFDALRSQ